MALPTTAAKPTAPKAARATARPQPPADQGDTASEGAKFEPKPATAQLSARDVTFKPIEMPELIHLAKALMGDVPEVKKLRTSRGEGLREALHLLLDPMAIMLAIAAAIYFVLGETRDAVVLALALIPVLGVDVLLYAMTH